MSETPRGSGTNGLMYPTLFLLAGIALGAFVWLWQAYGIQVVLAYAQDIAMMCF